MATRQSRSDRKLQTRGELLAAARRVFLERGFHGTSLEQIAEAAGYTTGAVYSNFSGKDGLFLAVLDEQYERRLAVSSQLAEDGVAFDDVVRAAARDMAQTYQRDPAWTPLLVEFWTHAASRPRLRAEVEKRHGRMLDRLAAAIETAAARSGVELTVPAREVARAANVLQRGMALESLVDTVDPATLIEQSLLAYMRGCVRGAPDPVEGGENR